MGEAGKPLDRSYDLTEALTCQIYALLSRWNGMEYQSVNLGLSLRHALVRFPPNAQEFGLVSVLFDGLGLELPVKVARDVAMGERIGVELVASRPRDGILQLRECRFDSRL